MTRGRRRWSQGRRLVAGPPGRTHPYPCPGTKAHQSVQRRLFTVYWRMVAGLRLAGVRCAARRQCGPCSPAAAGQFVRGTCPSLFGNRRPSALLDRGPPRVVVPVRCTAAPLQGATELIVVHACDASRAAGRSGRAAARRDACSTNCPGERRVYLCVCV